MYQLMYQLTIQQPSNLLSVTHQQTITPAQVSMVIAVLKASDLTYGEMLKFLSDRRRAEVKR